MKFVPAALLSLLSAKVTSAQVASYLFIGNSYTGTNELEVVFDSIIEDGIPEWKDQVYSRAVEEEGRTLARQIEQADGTQGDTPLRQLLVTDPILWDWVTLQDESQVPGFYQWDWAGTEFWRSTEAAIQLNDLIAAVGGQTMFFMTWGQRDGDANNQDIFPDFLTMQDMVAEGYRRYQEATTTLTRPTYLAPVGLVFKTIYLDELNEGIEPTDEGTLFRSLYQGDGSHPSERGTYVAALTIYSSMTGRSPTAINWWPEDITEDVARILQYAVSRTILDTLNSGEIDYPWTVAFDAGSPPPRTPAPTTRAPTLSPTTESPTTASPTESPTPRPTRTPRPTPSPATAEPTPRPTPPPRPTPAPATAEPTPRPTPPPRPTTAPATSTPNPSSTARPTPASTIPTPKTKGSLTITFEYDQYPQEIMWTLVHEGTDEALFFQPYRSYIRPNSIDVKTFSDLEPGEKYLLRIYDSENDGLCCDSGPGSFKVYDNIDEKELYNIKGEFKSYFEVTFLILDNGRARVLHRSAHYRPGTWTELETIIAPNDNAWPGLGPTQQRWSVMINVELDSLPKQMRWSLYRSGEDLSWVTIQTWDGFDSAHNTLVSTEVSNLETGWYKLVFKDGGGNGVCCDFGRGFVSIMGPLQSEKGQIGLVWGNNGQFKDEEEVLFHFENPGWVSEIRWSEDE